jgi:hypothetical protein
MFIAGSSALSRHIHASRSSPRPFITQHGRQDVQPEACLIKNLEQKTPQKEASNDFFNRRNRPSCKPLELVRNWLSQIERPKRRTTKTVKKLLPEVFKALNFFVPQKAVPSFAENPSGPLLQQV